jgi:hypothetical protein
MTQFKHHVENYKLPANLAKFPRNNFFRTTKHLAESVSVNDIHTGLSLWRKFASLKKYVNNIITPIYLKNLGPDDLIPSGIKSFLELRGDLFVGTEESFVLWINPAHYFGNLGSQKHVHTWTSHFGVEICCFVIPSHRMVAFTRCKGEGDCIVVVSISREYLGESCE